MDNVTQLQFELLDIAKMLLRKEGIADGRWTIGVNFTIAATAAGPSPETARPSMLVGVDKIIIARAEAGSPDALTVDAAALKD